MFPSIDLICFLNSIKSKLIFCSSECAKVLMPTFWDEEKQTDSFYFMSLSLSLFWILIEFCRQHISMHTHTYESPRKSVIIEWMSAIFFSCFVSLKKYGQLKKYNKRCSCLVVQFVLINCFLNIRFWEFCSDCKNGVFLSVCVCSACSIALIWKYSFALSLSLSFGLLLQLSLLLVLPILFYVMPINALIVLCC